MTFPFSRVPSYFFDLFGESSLLSSDTFRDGSVLARTGIREPTARTGDKDCGNLGDLTVALGDLIRDSTPPVLPLENRLGEVRADPLILVELFTLRVLVLLILLVLLLLLLLRLLVVFELADSSAGLVTSNLAMALLTVDSDFGTQESFVSDFSGVGELF